VYVGIARIVLQLPEARSLKDRRQVVRSFKERLAARLRVSIAEVGDVELRQLATLGVVTVARESAVCHRVLNEVKRMAQTLPAAVLSDIRAEVLSMGQAGEQIRGGVEGMLSSSDGWLWEEDDGVD
jgi:uncharacterized protein YlxP (DUF503 family)